MTEQFNVLVDVKSMMEEGRRSKTLADLTTTAAATLAQRAALPPTALTVVRESCLIYPYTAKIVVTKGY